MTTTLTNGTGRPPRKLLSEELDRLDSIIDSLAEGLPAAMAAAAREGTRQAVKDAVVEILSNPELGNQIRMQLEPEAPAPAESVRERPTLWSRIKSRLAATRAEVIRRLRAAKTLAATLCHSLAAVVPIQQIALVTGIGFAGGIVLHFAPAGLSAAVCAVAGALAAAVVRIGDWSRRVARTLLASG